MQHFFSDPRFAGIKPFEQKLWLASPTMHGEEQRWVDEAIQTNWVTTVGKNLDAIEQQIAALTGAQYAVALSSGTTVLHLAVRLAGEKLYGRVRANQGTLQNHKVFCSDLTFCASTNPIAYEGGEAVLIDADRETWGMSPKALEKAFRQFPDVRLLVTAHLFGTPTKMEEIRQIADAHGALIVEDAAESLGTEFCLHGEWVKAGTLGDFSCISFNGNKIITGSTGGIFLTDSEDDAKRIYRWSTQSREAAPWYQHEEIGYNYRMSNITAGIIRGQLPYLDEHIAQKRAIYERYRNGLSDLPIKMNPFDSEKSRPNHWLSCMVIDEDAMCPQERSETEARYSHVSGKSCPTEILEALATFNAEGRPIWKPMHLQPLYRTNSFISVDDPDVGTDIFRRGLCLPSDNKMTPDQQAVVIDIIHRCFR